MGVSKNRGTPKSSILIGFSIINHPFGVLLFLETPIWCYIDLLAPLWADGFFFHLKVPFLQKNPRGVGDVEV